MNHLKSRLPLLLISLLLLALATGAVFAKGAPQSITSGDDWAKTRASALSAAKNKDYPTAEKALTKMIARGASLKPGDPRMIMALEDLASVYANEHKYDQARTAYQRVLKICERKYGHDSPMLIKPLNDVIKVTCINGKCYDSIPELKRLLFIRRKAYGHDSREIPVMLLLIGEAYEKQGKFTEAISYFQQSVETEKKNTGVNSVMAVALSKNIDRAKKELEARNKRLETQRVMKPRTAVQAVKKP